MEMKELLKKLISTKSVSYTEKKIADFISTYLRQSNISYERIGNEIIAYSHNFNPKDFMLFAGHVDTVPINNSSTIPTESKGKIYGRGACDMKAGVAVMLKLAEQKSSSCFLFYTREEVPLPNGMTLLLRKKPFLRKAKFAFVLEPTDGAMQYGCNGRLLAKAIYKGKSGHASQPEKYENAIMNAAKAIAKLKTIQKHANSVESLSVTGISGGIGNNVIPSSCEVVFDYRYPPGFNVSEAKKRLEKLVGAKLQIITSEPAVCLSPNALKKARKLFPKHKFEIMRGWTDIAQLIPAGIPTLVFGPGSILQAHSDDEYVKITDVYNVYKNYCKILNI